MDPPRPAALRGRPWSAIIGRPGASQPLAPGALARTSGGTHTYVLGGMHSEKSKMLAGELYDPADAELAAERANARELCRLLRVSPAQDIQSLLTRLFGAPGPHAVTPPFFCDYGYNIDLAPDVYFNANCVLLDVCRIAIGARTLLGPGVHIHAASHPMDAAARKAGLEFGKPVSIGADAWIGGGAIICPGVTIGANTVIGAGSVVTRNVPPSVFAAGNPCRVIRPL